MSLMDVSLPKWPQMYVTGVPVTIEQAKEIIRRTDTFFTRGPSGNNQQFIKEVRKLVGMPPGYYDRPREVLSESATQQEKDAFLEKRRKEDEEDKATYQSFQARWQPLKTSYVQNTWVSCAFIGGPHGWCHPDGNIGFVDNVGKYPSVRGIFDDWVKLAEAFPFLDIGVTIYDREADDEGSRPVVSLKVKNGAVELLHPHVEDVHKDHPKAERRPGSVGNSVSDFAVNFDNPRRELGIEDSWIFEWAAKFGPTSS